MWSLRLDAFIPHDEGLLGQSAERTLEGERPHLDFDDSYTGGLSYLHAAAFRVFGSRSASLRDLLWAASLLFVAGFYSLAARHFGPWPAAGATLVALAWSLPCYFAALPSWYNLFFAVGALLALDQAIRSGRRWPLLLAGLCAGLSVAVKVVGLYTLGAAALIVLYDHQVRHRAGQGAAAAATSPLWAAFPPLLVGLCVLFLLRRAPWLDLALFAAPILALAALVGQEERRAKAKSWAERWPDLAARLGLLAAGAALPLAALALPMALAEGGLAAWWRGVFVLPQLRFDVARMPLPPMHLALLGLPVLVLLLALRRRLGWKGAALAMVAVLSLVVWGRRGELGHVLVWSAARSLLPILVLAGVWRLRGEASSGDGAGGESPRLSFAVLASAAFFNLVQYPFASQQYLHYTAPLLVLALGLHWRLGEDDDVAEGDPRPRRWALAVAGAGFYLFAALWLHFSGPFALGVALEPRLQTAPLAPERVGLRVTPAYAELYRRLIEITRRAAPPERPILALPDCPEVYFFTGRRNPTRHFFDALSAEPLDAARVEGLLDEVGLVVINREPEFSPPLDAAATAAITRSFPESLILGPYEVRYRRP